MLRLCIDKICLMGDVLHIICVYVPVLLSQFDFEIPSNFHATIEYNRYTI